MDAKRRSRAGGAAATQASREDSMIVDGSEVCMAALRGQI